MIDLQSIYRASTVLEISVLNDYTERLWDSRSISGGVLNSGTHLYPMVRNIFHQLR